MSDSSELQEHGWVAFALSLPEKPPTTFRFFERNDSFIVLGSDAVFTAKEVYKTHLVVKHIGPDKKVESVYLSRSNFESLVKELLLVRRYRVEIYQNKGTGKTQDWILESKASPGNLNELENILFGADSNEFVDSSGLVAINFSNINKELVVGVAYGDSILREFKVCEFSDSCSLTELEAVLVQMSPKECLLTASGSNNLLSEAKEVISRHNILLTECKLSDFSTSDVLQDLDRLLKSEDDSKLQSVMRPEADLKIALSGIAAIIKYLDLLADDNNFGQYTISTFNSKEYMKIDMSAVKALGLFPVSSEDCKNYSLMSLLNKCRTTQGQRILAQWIKQPLMDLKKIEVRLNIVESLIRDTELRQALYETHLKEMPDLQMLSRKFQRKKATLQDFYKVYIAVCHLPYLYQCLSGYSGPHSDCIQNNFCSDIKDIMEGFKKYQDMVTSILDLKAVESGDFLVKSEVDPRLDELRVLLEKADEMGNGELIKVAKDLGLEPNKTVKLEKCQQIGYYFRVTRKEEKAIRNKKSYITIDTKQSGIRFCNQSLKKINENYLSLRKSYEEHQRILVKEIINVAASYCHLMKQSGEILAILDVFVSFAYVAFNAPKPYVRPVLSEKGVKGIILKQARHPCLEVQPTIDFIPNDIEMRKEHHTFHFITGPNMGGKSTFIRSVALNVLMAQIGCFVPCSEAEISIVDAILTRVGAGDNPIKGVSTFMAEILEMKHILSVATSDSLIIIDELGRGTSTYDGLGLAWAFSEYIAKSIQAYCLFTTHFHELALLSDEIKSVNNLHVTALTSEDNITFLYKVKYGVCDQSFGIHVAEMANFPKSVIEEAKFKVQELETFENIKVHLDISTENEGKTRSSVYEEAQELIKQYLEEAKKIDVSTLTEAEIISAVNELKQKLCSVSNSFVQELVKKYSLTSVMS